MPGLRVEEEVRLEKEKNLKYGGTARVQLQWLHFDETEEPNMAHVERLKMAFIKDCRRLDARNHIPAVISRTDLDNAVRTAGLSSTTLLSNTEGNHPELVFPTGYRLECLHGRHRFLAA